MKTSHKALNQPVTPSVESPDVRAKYPRSDLQHPADVMGAPDTQPEADVMGAGGIHDAADTQPETDVMGGPDTPPKPT